jgi:hypothetical protein
MVGRGLDESVELARADAKLHALGVEPVNKIGGVADFEGIKANIPFVPLGVAKRGKEDAHARATALLGL